MRCLALLIIGYIGYAATASADVWVFTDGPFRQEIKTSSGSTIVVTVEEKANPCPCPDGECICDPGKCQCPNCPKHNPKKEKAGAERWQGKSTEDGRYVVLYTSEDCAPCQSLKKNLLELGLDEHVVLWSYKNLEEAAAAGHEELPTCVTYDDSKYVMGYVGGACKLETIRGWLEGRKSETVATPARPRTIYRAMPYRDMSRPAYRPANYYQAPRFTPYSGPRYYGGGCYGGACYGGGCATCR